VTAGLRLIGLTGGIGSGKSTVGRFLAGRGFPIIDADELARAVVAPGMPALDDIRALWPDVVVTQDLEGLGSRENRLDRKRLGAIVFADSAARARLEGILHPRIVALSNARVMALGRAGHRVAFYEASLLVETGRHKELDGLIVVDAPDEVRVARVAARDGLTPEAVRARMAAQMPMNDKRQVATAIIDNVGDLAALEQKVDDLLARLGLPPGA